MKANWKIALMCVAGLAFVATSCNKKNEPNNRDDEDGKVFVSKISVKDNSLADWDALPADYVFESVCNEASAMDGLKSVKVFADELYINLLVEINMDVVTDLVWPSFHVYVNTDNSDKTGGYGDQWTDANTDIMMETALYAEGEPYPYNPGVSNWYGEVGGSGWEWCPEGAANDESDCWCATVCAGDMPIGNSELVNGKFEIQLMRELIPTNAGWNENEFGIGVDIQQNWASVGILPNAEANDENPNGLAKKLQVKVYYEK